MLDHHHTPAKAAVMKHAEIVVESPDRDDYYSLGTVIGILVDDAEMARLSIDVLRELAQDEIGEGDEISEDMEVAAKQFQKILKDTAAVLRQRDGSYILSNREEVGIPKPGLIEEHPDGS
jgi:hypothetical protein